MASYLNGNVKCLQGVMLKYRYQLPMLDRESELKLHDPKCLLAKLYSAVNYTGSLIFILSIKYLSISHTDDIQSTA